MGYITYLLTVSFVIALAYFTTKYLSVTYQKGQSKRRIRIIEKVNLATDKHLWLIELGDKYYFMYSDRKGMTQIDSLESLPELPQEKFSYPPNTFQALLQKRGQLKNDQ